MATTIFDFGFTKHEETSVLRILVFANLTSPDDIQFNGYIVVDGTVRQVCHSNIILDNNTSRGAIPLSPFAYLPGISAGPHTVQFVVENTENDNINLTVRAGATIEVTELKQGAI